jgi:hypothetical protein
MKAFSGMALCHHKSVRTIVNISCIIAFGVEEIIAFWRCRSYRQYSVFDSYRSIHSVAPSSRKPLSALCKPLAFPCSLNNFAAWRKSWIAPA